MDAALDVVFLIRIGSISPDFLFLCLAVLCIFNLLNLAMSLCIVFRYLKKAHKLKYFKTLGLLILIKTVIKLVLIVYYAIKGKLRLILKFGIISQYPFEFLYFLLSLLLIIPFVWLAVLYMCKLRLIKNYYFPNKETPTSQANWYRNTEEELPYDPDGWQTSQERVLNPNDTLENSHFKQSDVVVVTVPT